MKSKLEVFHFLSVIDAGIFLYLFTVGHLMVYQFYVN